MVSFALPINAGIQPGQRISITDPLESELDQPDALVTEVAFRHDARRGFWTQVTAEVYVA